MTLGGSPPQLFRQVADGVVDIIWTVNGYTPGLFPRSEVFELPTIFVNDIAATNLAMRAMFDEYLAPEYEPVHVLFNHVHAGQAIQMATKPVHTVADTQGTKLRVPGPTGNDVVTAMGATPVTMPVPDLPQALSTSAVDGALIPWEIIPALKLQDVTKYQIEGPDKARFGTTTFQVSMNQDRWDSLPDDLKAVFDKNSGEDWLRQVAKVWRENDDHGIKVAVDAGNEHIVLTPDEMKTFNDALAPVVDKWVKDHTDFDFAGDRRGGQGQHGQVQVLSLPTNEADGADRFRRGADTGRPGRAIGRRPGRAHPVVGAPRRLPRGRPCRDDGAQRDLQHRLRGAVSGRLRTGQALRRDRDLHVPALLPARRRQRHRRHLHRRHERGQEGRDGAVLGDLRDRLFAPCSCARCRSAG